MAVKSWFIFQSHFLVLFCIMTKQKYGRKICHLDAVLCFARDQPAVALFSLPRMTAWQVVCFASVNSLCISDF